MTAVIDQNRQKPWEKEQISFNVWYRKRLQCDFGTVLNMVNLTRDIIRNDGGKGEMYQTFLANLQEAQSRLTKLLFELEEADMELALKLNDSICGTLDWAKKSEVSSLLPEIQNTKELSNLVEEMLNEKTQIKSTDEKKVGELINIELKVGVGPNAQVRCMSVSRGSTLLDLKNSISNLKKRKHVTFVRHGFKVEETIVLLNGDNIIAVVTSSEGPFEGFDESDEKGVSILPISPPPESKNKPQDVPAGGDDFLTSALNQQAPANGASVDALPASKHQETTTDALSFINEVVLNQEDIEVDINIEADVDKQVDNNPFGPLVEQSQKTVFDPLEEQSKPAVESLLEQPNPEVSANPFEEFENDEEAPLISFDRFLVGNSNESKEEAKAKDANETTEEDNLLGDKCNAKDSGDLDNQDSFPKFAGFN